MLIWCLNQFKDFILKIRQVEFFFRERIFELVLYTIALVSFPSGRCLDVVFDNRTNHQGYKSVYFLQYHTLTVIIYFMDGEEVC